MSPRKGTSLSAPIGAGNPKNVAGAALIGGARRDEEIVGKPVDIGERRRADLLALDMAQRDDVALGAPADRAGEVERRRGLAAARQDEGAQRGKIGVERVDRFLQRRD